MHIINFFNYVIMSLCHSIAMFIWSFQSIILNFALVVTSKVDLNISLPTMCVVQGKVMFSQASVILSGEGGVPKSILNYESLDPPLPARQMGERPLPRPGR